MPTGPPGLSSKDMGALSIRVRRVFYLSASRSMLPHIPATPAHCRPLKGERKTHEIIT